MGDWQSIETAPKDGTKILVSYRYADGGQTLMIVHWKDNLFWDTGYWMLHHEPTHWMPLPAPP